MNFGVALALVLVSAVAGAPAAWAASSPWVPPSGGDVEALQDTVNGQVTAEIGSIEITSGPVGTSGSIYIAYPCELANGPTGGVWVKLCGGYLSGSTSGVVSSAKGTGLAWSTGRTVTCSNGQTPGALSYGSWNSTTGFLEVGGVSSACGGGSVVLSRGHQGTSWDQGLGYEMTLNPGGSVQATCSDGQSVTMVSASGYGALSVSCPAGMVVVGTNVNGSSYQMPGYATSPVTAVACARGECAPKVRSGGYSCDPTMAISTDPEWCRRAGNGGSLPPSATCEWQHPTMGVIVLPLTDCASWLEGVAGPPVGDPEDSDAGILAEWMQRILDAINRVRGAVEAVREAVEGARAGIVEAIGGIEVGGGGDPGEQTGMSVCGRDPVSNWANPAEWAYDALECALVPSPGFMDDWLDGFGAGLTAGLGPWSPGNPDGPIFGVASAVGGLSGGQCSCGGFTIEILGGEYALLDTCQSGSIERMLRDTCHALAGAAVVVAGVMTCGGLIARAFGVPWFRDEVKNVFEDWKDYD